MKRFVLLPLLLLASAGCSETQPYVSDSRLDRGLVIVLPGIEGPSRFNREICDGLAEGGVDCAIETYDWTIFLGPLYNLRAQARNRRQAALVADRVVRYHMACPGRPVWLVGQSGGGAIAIWAAELLPPEHRVDGIVLLAASLSPYYMLDLAIQRSRRGVVSFYSAKDWFLLATNVTGTMDGELSSSAGRTGFLYPEQGSRPPAYAHLFQVPWDRQMGRAGNTGGHLTSGASGFVVRYVVPLLGLKEWDEDSVERVMTAGHGEGNGSDDLDGRSGPKSRPANSPASLPAERPGVPSLPSPLSAVDSPAPDPAPPVRSVPVRAFSGPPPYGGTTNPPSDANVRGPASRPVALPRPPGPWD